MHLRSLKKKRKQNFDSISEMEMFRKEKIKSKSLLTLESVLLTTEWFLLYSRRKNVFVGGVEGEGRSKHGFKIKKKKILQTVKVE